MYFVCVASVDKDRIPVPRAHPSNQQIPRLYRPTYESIAEGASQHGRVPEPAHTIKYTTHGTEHTRPKVTDAKPKRQKDISQQHHHHQQIIDDTIKHSYDLDSTSLQLHYKALHRCTFLLTCIQPLYPQLALAQLNIQVVNPPTPRI